MKTTNRFSWLNISSDSTNDPQIEKLEYEILFEAEYKDGIYKGGKTSYTAKFDPNFAYAVTEISMPGATMEMTTLLVDNLKSCKCEQVVSPLFAAEGRIVIQENVSFTINQWINEEFRKNRILKGGKWINMVKEKLFAYYRQFALGTMHLHKQKYYYNGEVEDLLIIGGKVKMLSISKFGGTDKEFERKQWAAVNDFRNYFWWCITLPSCQGKGERRSSGYFLPGEKERLRLGVCGEIMEALKDFTITKCLPPDAVFNHPIFYSTVEKIAFINKVHDEITYDGMTDGIVDALNSKLRQENDMWKHSIKDDRIHELLGNADARRTNQLDMFYKGHYIYKTVYPKQDYNLFGDLCGVFYNAMGHFKITDDVENFKKEDVFRYIEKRIPGGVTKIYGLLLDESTKTNDEEIREKRYNFFEKKEG